MANVNTTHLNNNQSSIISQVFSNEYILAWTFISGHESANNINEKAMLMYRRTVNILWLSSRLALGGEFIGDLWFVSNGTW